MAEFTVTALYTAEGGGTLELSGPTQFLQPGDKVNFQSAGGGTVVFSNFSSSFWTDPSSISGSGYKIVKSGLTNGTLTDVLGTHSFSGSTDFIECRIQAQDTMPDYIGIPDITNADPKQNYELGPFSVTGINVPVGVSVSGGRDVLIKKTIYNFWESDGAIGVENGQAFKIWCRAELDYGQSNTVTVNYGDRTETFNVINKTYPDPDQILHIGITGTQDISLKADVAAFFGRVRDDPHVFLTEYVRSGELVPNILLNDHVPLNPPINLSDLRDTYTAFYFIYTPINKIDYADTTSGAQSMGLRWDALLDYEIGFGWLQREVTYKYVVNVNVASGSASISNLSVGHPGAAQSWVGNTYTVPYSTANDYLSLSITAGANTEGVMTGTLEVWAMNVIDNTWEINRTATWAITWSGP